MLVETKTPIINLGRYVDQGKNKWFTHILTPWSTVLLEKLTSSQLVKKFPTFYGTQRFITTFKSARRLSLLSARSIPSMPPPTPLPENPS